MALQQVFTNNYIEQLKNSIEVSKYRAEEFEYDSSQTRYLYGVQHPADLCNYMVENYSNDFLCAKAFYEAYKNITPVFAQEDKLWVYLSHVDLYPYLKKRWPLPEDEEKVEDYIKDHWFKSPYGVIRSALMGLWWSVHLSIDEERENPYELTEVLFSNYSLRVVYFGATLLFRYKEAALGILQFFKECPEVMDCMEVRVRVISRYFSMLGGTRNLYSMRHDFFLKECYRIKDGLLKITKREEIENKDIYTILRYKYSYGTTESI